MKAALIAFSTLACLVLPVVVTAGGAAAAPTALSLRADTTDADGRITLGDLFVNAGAAADVQVGTRTGASAVLDAAAVQALAARAGVYWDNPRGLRRIIVTQGTDGDGGTPVATANLNTANAPSAWPAAATPAASGPVVVRRNDVVAVTWSSNGLSLTLSGTAQKDAAVGDPVPVMNTSSKKMIDAVVTGPGTAVAGQAADRFRSQVLLSSR